ncbi:MAG TPA: YciI family protein [Cyclobacteriaceae bacterium]|nr:YciI family protein [Cyclobacteriaceae bacterium]HRF35224.1 YciI family protein [Cyclobacteriaceae bacterium]
MKTFILILLLLPGISLAQAPELIFVFLNKRTDKAELPEAEVKKIMEGHLANIERLAKEGKLVSAGPFDGGGGIFIFKSNSVEQVKEWLKTDPGIQANRWRVEVLPYYPRIGGACAVGEHYEMVTYHFVRYIPNIAKFNIQDAPRIFMMHDNYLKEIAKTGNVITEATFGDNEGGILIMKGNLEQEVIETDPAVRQGLLQIEIQKLWIAKGGLCEK